MVAVAQKYANAVIGLPRNGLDRAVAAHALWERCAIPAILYCLEAMVLSKGVLKNLEVSNTWLLGTFCSYPNPWSTLQGH